MKRPRRFSHNSPARGRLGTRRWGWGLLLPPLVLALGACGFGDSSQPIVARTMAEASMQTYAVLVAEARGETPDLRSATKSKPATEPTPAAASVPQPLKGAGTAALQIAGLPPANEPGIALRVRFDGNAAALSEEAQVGLSALAAELRGNQTRPVEIIAYWTGEGEPGSSAKLQALKRAILVRSFLNQQGFEAARIVFQRVGEDAQPSVIDVLRPRS